MKQFVLLMIAFCFLSGCEKKVERIAAEHVDFNFEIQSFLGFEFGKENKNNGVSMTEVRLACPWMGFETARLFYPQCVYEVRLVKAYGGSENDKKSAIANVDELARMFARKYPMAFYKNDKSVRVDGVRYEQVFAGDATSVIIALSCNVENKWGVEVSVTNIKVKKAFEAVRIKKANDFKSDFDRM